MTNRPGAARLGARRAGAWLLGIRRRAGPAGPGGYAVAWDEPEWAEGEDAASATVTGTEAGDTVEWRIPGAEIEGSDTAAGASYQITGLDLSALEPGPVTIEARLVRDEVTGPWRSDVAVIVAEEPGGYEVPPYDQWDWTDEPLGYEVPAADAWEFD